MARTQWPFKVIQINEVVAVFGKGGRRFVGTIILIVTMILFGGPQDPSAPVVFSGVVSRLQQCILIT